VYRRTVDGQVLDFGTSGLLRFSNLVMYDRQTESWWQEFGGEPIVGHYLGKKLEMLPLRIMSWKDFKSSFPGGKVLSKNTGHARPYGQNPYVAYDSFSSPFLYDGPEDRRVPMLERVVGIKIGEQSVAVPYSVIEQKGLVQLKIAGDSLLIVHRKGLASSLDDYDVAGGRDIGAVDTFSAAVDGRALTFRLQEEALVDRETGTAWTKQGLGIRGPLEGKQLRLATHSSAFWFAWSAFAPGTTIYRGD